MAPLLYDFSDVVAQLESVQHFDWSGYLRTQLDKVGPDAPLDGLARAGWRLARTDKKSDYSKAAEAYRKPSSCCSRTAPTTA